MIKNLWNDERFWWFVGIGFVVTWFLSGCVSTKRYKKSIIAAYEIGLFEGYDAGYKQEKLEEFEWEYEEQNKKL